MKNKSTKPVVTLHDDNIFSIMGVCSKALKKAGKVKEANDLVTQVMDSESYENALVICQKYVEFDE
jgi:hypothetical protein